MCVISNRSIAASVLAITSILLLATPVSLAQNPQLQEKVSQIKEASAANKQVLSQYTWQEQQTVSIKGEVKKQELFQVQIGPDGKQQKTPLGPPPQQQAQSGGRLKHKIVEKKTEEFEEYAHQVADLARSYAHPQPELLQQAYEKGNVTLGSAGAPGEAQLVVRDYIKPGDSVTMVFDTAQKALMSLKVASYLSDPKDAVTISAQFAREAEGPNHVATMIVDGVSKKLTVNIQNSNYRKLGG